jgi:5-methylcytosine-specific restriction enzyme A
MESIDYVLEVGVVLLVVIVFIVHFVRKRRDNAEKQRDKKYFKRLE